MKPDTLLFSAEGSVAMSTPTVVVALFEGVIERRDRRSSVFEALVMSRLLTLRAASVASIALAPNATSPTLCSRS